VEPTPEAKAKAYSLTFDAYVYDNGFTGSVLPMEDYEQF
jgi:hypothetical protein